MGQLKSVLITGAAGSIGTLVRRAVRTECKLLRCTDIVSLEPESPNEETLAIDLADRLAVEAAMEGIDTVFHFGGIPHEDEWGAISRANIDGTYNVYEGARRRGVRRVVFASSNHVLGFRRRDHEAGVDAPLRPDSRYAVSKVLGEALGRLYADKYGVETISLRIGQFRPRPTNLRMLSLWLSPNDMERLALSCLRAKNIHFEIVYGVSDNSRAWYDNSGAAKIGFVPQDNAEDFVQGFSKEALREGEIDAPFQGGPFCADEFSGDLTRID